MIVSFYKEYFEVELRHASAPGEICASFSLTPSVKCRSNFQNFRMTYRKSPGEIMVFYSGKEIPGDPGPPKKPPKLDPFPEIPPGTEFLFIVSADNKEILKITKMPTEPDINVEDLQKVIPWTFIMPAVFSSTFDHTASTKLYEPLIVKAESGEVVYQSTIKKAGSADDTTPGAYICSVDLSLSEPGIYSLNLGTGEKKYYVDTTNEIAGNYGFIRFIKDTTWKKPTVLEFGIPVDYNQFLYTFEYPDP